VTAPPAERLRDQSLGELLSQLGNDSSLLIRQELQLAKAEMTEKAAAAGVGVGLGLVAGVLLLAALGAGVTAAIAALSYVVPQWAAALITLGGLVVVAALLGVTAALRLKKAMPPVPQQAIQTGKETPHELLH
jgi:tetrahydromethanopterin S-methyltransferase subunit C